jgi:thiol-disulfide isomerase/thioredoxin
MTERLMVLALAVTAGLLAWAIWRVYQRGRLARVATHAVPVEVKRLSDGQRPAVLYFTTPDCAQCRLQQAPILSQLAARIDVAVHKLDAVEQEALARFYGIMTVPTTIVLDPQLRPVAINHGVAPLPKLQAQVESLRG